MRKLIQKDIQHWQKFTPIESHYSRYTPATIASAYKIVDVYQMFSMARWNNGFYLENDYGHLCNKDHEISMKFTRSMFLLNSLAYYNNAIDLTWQVIWYYYNTDTYDLIYDEDLYNDISSNCDFESLIRLLKYRATYPAKEGAVAKEIQELAISFFNDDTTLEVRKMYNYFKHRGSYYVDGLGQNSPDTMYAINGSPLKLLTRRELKLEETSVLLEKFDGLFVDYMNKIIKGLMPYDYFNTNLDLNGVLNTYFNIKDKL